ATARPEGGTGPQAYSAAPPDFGRLPSPYPGPVLTGLAQHWSMYATVTLATPGPILTSLSPNSAAAGGAAFTLTVNGSNFVAGAVVQWNGAARTTTFGAAARRVGEVAES